MPTISDLFGSAATAGVDVTMATVEADDMLFNSDMSGVGLLAVDPREVKRAETAPMVLTVVSADGTICFGGLTEEAAPGEEYRFTKEYYQLYYSKVPRDPRMLHPLIRRRPVIQKEASADAIHSERRPTPRPATEDKTSGAVGEQVPSAVEGTGEEGASEEDTSSAASPSSSRLREYLSNCRPEWDYNSVQGHVNAFSRDQDGSRLVQRLLERPENLVPIFEEVLPLFEELTMDVFGNYVIQKLFEVLSRQEMTDAKGEKLPAARVMELLTQCVRGNFKRLSFQTYGCRVMQKAVGSIQGDDREAVIQELADCVVDCVFHQNANHVVQRIIEVCPERSQFIVDAFLPRLFELACHAYGCRVLQRLFEKCHGTPGVDVCPLLEAIVGRLSELTIHQYGNYVVQHGMLNAPEAFRARFVALLTPQTYALSCSKFASNVAEKVVTTANDAERDELIAELTQPLGETQGGNYLVHMMQDTYANYVVQRLVEASSYEQRVRIGESVMPFVEMVLPSVYGRHLLRKMELLEVLPKDYLRLHGVDVNAAEYGGGTARTAGGYVFPGGPPAAAAPPGRGRRHRDRRPPPQAYVVLNRPGLPVLPNYGPGMSNLVGVPDGLAPLSGLLPFHPRPGGGMPGYGFAPPGGRYPSPATPSTALSFSMANALYTAHAPPDLVHSLAESHPNAYFAHSGHAGVPVPAPPHSHFYPSAAGEYMPNRAACTATTQAPVPIPSSVSPLPTKQRDTERGGKGRRSHPTADQCDAEPSPLDNSHARPVKPRPTE